MLIRTTSECVGPVIGQDAEGRPIEERYPKGRVVDVPDTALAEKFIALGGAVAATEEEIAAHKAAAKE